jgi:disintegrin and metalloproteinase domain-containing protein 10
MRDVQASGERIPTSPNNSASQTEPVDSEPAAKYRRDFNEPTPSNRAKRSPSANTEKHRLCNLYIQTDKFLWDAVYEREKDEQRTREEILSIIATHIKAVTRIYGNHQFGDIVGIQFAVQRTTVLNNFWKKRN